MAISKSNAGWWGFPLAALTVLGIGVSLSLFLTTLGWPIFPKAEEKVEAPVPTAEIVSQWNVSPAMSTLTQSLEAPPGGWEGTGNIMTAPQTPYPFSCVAEGVNPAVSLGKNFNARGKSIQVLTTAYSAGLGAQGMATKFNKAPSCAGGDAAYSLQKLDGIGTEVYQAVTSKSNLNIRTIIWRYGDIVVYLIADSNNPDAFALASEFHENMMSKLNGACLAANYDDADMTRSPFSGAEFKGYFVGKKVTIPEVKKPAIPAGETFKPTEIPAPDVEVREIILPIKPTEYPVWPELPAPMEEPVIPTAPSPDSPTEKDIRIKAQDLEGPGCGWDFTGSTSPFYDEEQANAYNKAEEDKATAELNAAAKKWQQEVLAYWKDYSTFTANVPLWNDYGAKVDGVAKAWAKIETDWANYRQAKETYDANVANRDAFIKEKEAATKSYEENIEQCKVQDARDAENETKQAEEKRKWDEAERKRVEAELRQIAADRRAFEEARRKAAEEAAEDARNNPRPTNSPSPTPSPTPTPEPTFEAETPTPRPYVPPVDNTPRVNCPAERPAIMDQAAPEVGPAPTPPADPRPASARS